MRFGGPDFAILENNLFISGTRVYEDPQYTGLFLVDRTGLFRKILRLPSGGDNEIIGDRKVHYRRNYNNIQILIYEGKHEMLNDVVLDLIPVNDK